MKYQAIKNWKLREVIDDIKIIAEDSIQHIDKLLIEHQVPQSKDLTGMNRSETSIDWLKMSQYYKFFFDSDKEDWEERVKEWLKQSQLLKTEEIIITYGWKEPVVKLPTKLFFEDWEGFIRSAKFETIIYSEDFSLIMEVSRDYYLHSNFEIMPDSECSNKFA